MKNVIIFVLGVVITYVCINYGDEVLLKIRNLNCSATLDALRGAQTAQIAPEEEERRLETWANDRPRYVRERDALRQILGARLSSSGYVYSSSRADAASKGIDALSAAINGDDYAHAPEIFQAANNAVRDFMGTCRWKSGLSMGPGTHMHSGFQEGEWVPDAGYEMINGRAVKRETCRHCNGQGYNNVEVACSRCNGARRIVNPNYEFAEGANMIGGMFEGLGSGFGSAAGRMMRGAGSGVSQYISCPSCNGTGTLVKRQGCGYCSGRGCNYVE